MKSTAIHCGSIADRTDTSCVLSVLVGLTLVVAAWAKAYTPTESWHSLTTVLALAGMGSKAAMALQALVVIEVVLGALLLLRGDRWVRWAVFGLLATFVIYGLALIGFGVPVGCGCGLAIRLPGVDDRWFSVVRAGIMAAAVFPR